MESKSIFVSKTFWLNAITLAIAIIGITKPEILHINADTLLWITSVLNIILRYISSGAVSITGSSQQSK